MKIFLRVVLLAFFIYFFSWFLVYKTNINDLAIQSEDTLPSIFIPVTLLEEGTLYADKYYDMIIDKYPHPDDKDYTRGLTPFYFKKVTEDPMRTTSVRTANAQTQAISYENHNYHYVSAFPIISALLAVPVYAIPLLLGVSVTWSSLIILSHISAALLMALAGGFLYILLKDGFKLDSKKAEMLAYVYLFATVNFAMISQALWQHGSVQLLTILSLIFLFKFLNSKTKETDKSYMHLYLSAFFFGFAFLARPTVALFLAPFVLLLYQAQWRYPIEFFKSMTAYFVGIIPAFLFFIWYNSTYYYSVFNQGYAGQATSGWLSSLPEGFAGLWLAPSKGILIYSPVLLFSLVGLWLVFKELKQKKNWDKNLKYILFAVIILLHTLVLGKWKHWYGGWSFGYRMASDVLPFFILLLVPYVTADLFAKSKKVFYLLFGVSVLVQAHGIIFFDGIWHAAYDDGFVETKWLWSVKDSEFAFNFRRVLVKLGLLEKACPQCMPVK